MDALDQWGVLVEPEKLGISVEYVFPSMIVPKPDSNEYRLVTDFSSLNLYLKKSLILRLLLQRLNHE